MWARSWHKNKDFSIWASWGRGRGRNWGREGGRGNNHLLPPEVLFNALLKNADSFCTAVPTAEAACWHIDKVLRRAQIWARYKEMRVPHSWIKATCMKWLLPGKGSFWCRRLLFWFQIKGRLGGLGLVLRAAWLTYLCHSSRHRIVCLEARKDLKQMREGWGDKATTALC